MSAEDMSLRSDVRNALARHWIDLTKTNFMVRRGHVHLNGEASVIGAPAQAKDTPEVLKAFEADVRRLKDVKSVSFEFTNWIRADSGEWNCIARRTSGGSAKQATADDAGDGGFPH